MTKNVLFCFIKKKTCPCHINMVDKNGNGDASLTDNSVRSQLILWKRRDFNKIIILAKLNCRSIRKCKIQHCQACWYKYSRLTKSIMHVALCVISWNMHLLSSLHRKSCWPRETPAAINSLSHKTQDWKQQSHHYFQCVMKSKWKQLVTDKTCVTTKIKFST